jgi:putative membrane protein
MDKTAQKHRKIIIALSIVIPLAVAALFGIKLEVTLPVFLPPIYAAINAVTAIVLIVAFWSIKNGKRELHEALMKTAIVLSSIFLILYVLYHITSNATHFGGTGLIRYVYFFILISHIILSITIIPLVLITFSRAWLKNFSQHKKIARITFPLWLYVTITGVLVYVLIAPYYIT